jgi:hypothetical protein
MLNVMASSLASRIAAPQLLQGAGLLAMNDDAVRQ